MQTRLDTSDLRLLDEFQRDLPLVSQPYKAMGEALGIGEAEVLERLSAMRARGLISRIGATVRPNTAGASTLAAIAVPEHLIEDVAAEVSAEPGVNHSYLREDEWNLWFVATAPCAGELEAVLARIARRTGLRVLDLRLVRPFNIDLGFRLTGAATVPAARRSVTMSELNGTDRPILQALAAGLPLVPRPFAAAAAALGIAESRLLSRIGALLGAGIISRLGVIVRHRALGWTSNAMVVWDVEEDRIEAAGRAAAAHPGVTLCYQRRREAELWPYSLYNMVHARSRREALDVISSLERLPGLQGASRRVLFSTRCFKQTGALLHRGEFAA